MRSHSLIRHKVGSTNPSIIRRSTPILWALLVLAATAGSSLAQSAPAGASRQRPPFAAVFNFKLTTNNAEWVWLEKGLADRITTDLAQSRKVVVIARDQMQAAAQRLKWAPELMQEDEGLAGRIRKEFQIEFLVTGLCRLKDQQVTATVQVIRIQDRKEVHRSEVSSPATDVLIEFRKSNGDKVTIYVA